MQMLKKIFNSESKYYLELNEAENPETVKTETTSAQKVASEKVASEKVAAVKTETTSKEVNVGKVEVAEAKGQVAKKEVQPTAKKSTASSYEPPFWVAAMNNTNNKGSSNGSGQGAEVTFASDNLMPTITKYRRLPGGSLAKFRAMAKTAKTPKR